jgi:hypothetical protein
MGLFNFNRKKQIGQEQDSKSSNSGIPEKDNGQIDVSNNGSIRGIDHIYSFLQADYESRGYGDALVNPDESNKMDNIKLIKLDLQILIEKVDVYYDNLISELNFHINSRSRAGLIDLVQELESRKKLVEDYKIKLKQMNGDIEKDSGVCQRVILSYQRGFTRGLSALTQSNILNKKI